jgi:hypothetical protein
LGELGVTDPHEPQLVIHRHVVLFVLTFGQCQQIGLRVSRATVYRLAQAGTLPVLKVSNSIRIPAGPLAP